MLHTTNTPPLNFGVLGDIDIQSCEAIQPTFLNRYFNYIAKPDIEENLSYINKKFHYACMDRVYCVEIYFEDKVERWFFCNQLDNRFLFMFKDLEDRSVKYQVYVYCGATYNNRISRIQLAKCKYTQRIVIAGSGRSDNVLLLKEIEVKTNDPILCGGSVVNTIQSVYNTLYETTKLPFLLGMGASPTTKQPINMDKKALDSIQRYTQSSVELQNFMYEGVHGGNPRQFASETYAEFWRDDYSYENEMNSPLIRDLYMYSYVRDLNQAIIQYGKLYKNAQFYRSTTFPHCKGDVFETKSITSCVYSLNGAVAEYAGNNPCCLFELQGDIFGLKIPSALGSHGEEYEIILPVGSVFRFIETRNVFLDVNQFYYTRYDNGRLERKIWEQSEYSRALQIMKTQVFESEGVIPEIDQITKQVFAKISQTPRGTPKYLDALRRAIFKLDRGEDPEIRIPEDYISENGNVDYLLD